VKNICFSSLIFFLALFSVSAQISSSAFVTGVSMRAFVNATLTYLKIGMSEKD
jgi:hypothetical protein